MSAAAPAADEGAVRLRGADLGHARRAVLSGLDLRAEAGERILLLGANGTGKSTLIATLAGLLRPVSGTVRVLGLDPVADRRALHRAAGHLGHLDPFYPELTGRENLILHARLRGLGTADADRRLAASGLGDASGRPVGAYSHGMRRRLGLAKALLGAPRLLLLDEPDAGLDRAARIDLAGRLSAVADATVVAATHHPEEHAGWARRAWVLADGRLVADVRAPGGGLLGEVGLRAARAAAEATA